MIILVVLKRQVQIDLRSRVRTADTTPSIFSVNLYRKERQQLCKKTL